MESGNVSRVQISDDQVQIVIGEESDITEVEKILYPDGRSDNTQAAPAAGDNYIRSLRKAKKSQANGTII